MQPFFDEQKFVSLENGIFANDQKAAEIRYDEARQQYILAVANVNEDKSFGEYKEINAWLFDDSQNAKDAQAVGIDFVTSLRKELGIKFKRTVDGANVELPTANKSGSVNIQGLTKKILDFYPALKDAYKAHVAQYGNFLYLNFYGEFLVPCLKKTFTDNNKKQIKKLYDVFGDIYVKGDRDTVNAVVVVLCAAAYNDEKVTEAIREMLAEDKHFLDSFNGLIPFFAKNKKLLNALIK